MTDKYELPSNIVKYLDNNTAFNMFGFVNLAKLKYETECTIEDETLKILIQEKFGNEMVTGTVEFIEPKSK